MILKYVFNFRVKFFPWQDQCLSFFTGSTENEDRYPASQPTVAVGRGEAESRPFGGRVAGRPPEVGQHGLVDVRDDGPEHRLLSGILRGHSVHVQAHNLVG